MFDYEGEKDHEGFVERVIVVIMIWKGKEYNTLDGSGMINVLLKDQVSNILVVELRCGKKDE